MNLGQRFGSLTTLGVSKNDTNFSLIGDETAYKFKPARYNFYSNVLNLLSSGDYKTQHKILTEILGVENITRFRREKIGREEQDLVDNLRYLINKKGNNDQARKLINELSLRIKRNPITRGINLQYIQTPDDVVYKKYDNPTPLKNTVLINRNIAFDKEWVAKKEIEINKLLDKLLNQITPARITEIEKDIKQILEEVTSREKRFNDMSGGNKTVGLKQEDAPEDLKALLDKLSVIKEFLTNLLKIINNHNPKEIKDLFRQPKYKDIVSKDILLKIGDSIYVQLKDGTVVPAVVSTIDNIVSVKLTDNTTHTGTPLHNIITAKLTDGTVVQVIDNPIKVTLTDGTNAQAYQIEDKILIKINDNVIVEADSIRPTLVGGNNSKTKKHNKNYETKPNKTNKPKKHNNANNEIDSKSESNSKKLDIPKSSCSVQ